MGARRKFSRNKGVFVENNPAQCLLGTSSRAGLVPAAGAVADPHLPLPSRRSAKAPFTGTGYRFLSATSSFLRTRTAGDVAGKGDLSLDSSPPAKVVFSE